MTHAYIIYIYMLHRICSWKCHYAGTRVPPFPQYASSSLHDHVIRLRILPKSIRKMQKNPGAQLLPGLCPISISSWLNHAKNSHQSPLYFGGFKLRNSISGLMRISKPSVPYPIGSMYGIYMVTWIPSIYLLYVSIKIPAPAGSVMGIAKQP